MSLMLINGRTEANGEMSFSQEIVGNKIVFEGILSLDFYEQELETVETDFAILSGINVEKEMFGTDDNVVVYKFTAQGLHIDEDKLNSKLRGSEG